MAVVASILIADDNEDLRELLREYLEHVGYQIRTATDGHDAIQQFTADPSDLVITDLNMPGENGLRVLQRIQTVRPGTPVIVLTGQNAADPEIEEAYRLGVFRCLAKPLADLRILPQMVEIALTTNWSQTGPDA